MIILGIETSCDETAVAIVQKENENIKVLASVVATSLELHSKTGGIIPETAAREQIKYIIPAIDECLKIAKLKIENLTAIAVTVGPGLIGSLLVGIETAKTLSLVWDKPIVPVNHLVAHLYACFVENKPEFPAVGLVVSGGHTDFVYMTRSASLGQVEIEYIGGTRDDAAGEAFDKCARIIGLGYPGGPAIAEAASFLRKQESIQTKLDLFPRPMANTNDLDMSFSGLKTSVLNRVKEQESGRVEVLSTERLAAEIQEAIIDVIVKKSRLAIKNYNPKSFIVSGGVSANKLLREKLFTLVRSVGEDLKLYVPEAKLSTDNAVMIATYALENYRIKNLQEINAMPSLGIDEML